MNRPPSLVEVLRSSRTLLCRPREADIPYLYEWATSTVSRGNYLATESITLPEISRRFASDYYWNNRSRTYIIRLKETNAPIGSIHFWEKDNDHTTALVAVLIAYPHLRGNGFGTEVQSILVQTLFRHFHYESVEMLTDTENIAEQRCLEKLGFRFAKATIYQDLETNRPGKLYVLTKQEHQQLELVQYQ